MKRIEIKKNWYFSAGGKYKWEKNHDRRGVGIRLDALKENSELEISIAGGLYTLDCAQAITFVRHYRSLDIIKGTKIAIVAKDLLKPVVEPQVTEEKPANPPVVENEVLQSKLF